ncbi:MAG TPA: hypothetical protein VHP33_17770 [Polyangiaceae bacterium]|nr:hypothetical protein [Polyangiaceae bacterium]
MLVSQHAHGTVLSPCAKCGAEVAIFPGAKHHASERALFAELSEGVHAAVSPGSATACLSDIEDLAHDAPELILSMVTARIPALTKLLVSTKSSASAASVAAMLLTMLRARSSMRSHSGFIVSCGPVAQATESAAPPSTRRSSSR